MKLNLEKDQIDTYFELLAETFDASSVSYGTNAPHFDNLKIDTDGRRYDSSFVLGQNDYVSVSLYGHNHPSRPISTYEVSFKHATSAEGLEYAHFDRSKSGRALSIISSVIFMVSEILRRHPNINGICFYGDDEQLNRFYGKLIESGGIVRMLKSRGFEYEGTIRVDGSDSYSFVRV